ncbi:hypothetical protein [Emticicia soli]|uniref:Uncharacterized protein n=1 Tax=Emticicia soli TaxID=2027878 RepID=A0ABW5J6Q8_9BACT
MEHKLDDFFRKKIESTEDTIPESSTFDEQAFWGELQKNIDKPQPKNWWKWVALAACIGGLALWGILLPKPLPQQPQTSRVKKIVESIKEKQDPITAVAPQKTKKQTPQVKPKQTIEPNKDLEIAVAELSFKPTPLPTQALVIKQDSIHINPVSAPTVMAEAKPQFKKIHVNEISNTEQSPMPQPKFKIRFAARNQH